MRDKLKTGLRAIGADTEASSQAKSVQVWKRFLVAWVLIGVVIIAFPVFVGGSFDPCQAAVNSVLKRQPLPEPMNVAAGQYMVASMRQQGIVACYQATFSEAFE